MKAATVSIQFEKKVSDNNYGSEMVSVFVTAEMDEGEEVVTVGAELSAYARAVATGQLSLSPSLAVRRSLERQEPRPAREDEL